MRHSPRSFLYCLAVLSLTARLASAQDEPLFLRGAESIGEPVVPQIIDVDLRDLPTAPQWQPGDPIREVPRRGGDAGEFQPEPPTGPDPLVGLQEEAPQGASLDELLNFAGQGFNGVQPPDTVGDVGPLYFIQMINCGSGSCLVVYDKTDGSIVSGPTVLDTLGSGGSCASGLGDPIVLYDPLADRWMLSEFASSGNHLCVYISMTSDPVSGGWCRYDFSTPQFPDYPKYAVWPDAYYVTTNESDRAVYAVDRENMVVCGTARPFQRFLVPDLSFGFNALTPADLDGATPPPAGAPGIIMGHRDTEAHGPGGFPDEDRLEQFFFDVDWDVPGNSTLTQQPDVVTEEFDSELCGFVSFNCFPQPSGPTLDPLREVIMWRLSYRNFGSHETLVGNFVTDVDDTDHGGKRWFELRKTGGEGGAWSVFQEGTYSLDEHNRWMGAVAMDGGGNMALAYNIVSEALHSGLRYTGRQVGDPPGTMTAPEVELVPGGGSNSSNRYGDYAAMGVDPEDECTFWFTGEYNPTAQWATRIGAFRWSGCTPGTIFVDGFESGDTDAWDTTTD